MKFAVLHLKAFLYNKVFLSSFSPGLYHWFVPLRRHGNGTHALLINLHKLHLVVMRSENDVPFTSSDFGVCYLVIDVTIRV